MFSHHVKQVHQGVEVVAVVEQRLLHRLPYRLGGGEVDDTLDVGICVKEDLDSGQVSAVGFDEFRADACDALDAVKNLAVGV